MPTGRSGRLPKSSSNMLHHCLVRSFEKAVAAYIVASIRRGFSRSCLEHIMIRSAHRQSGQVGTAGASPGAGSARRDPRRRA